MKTIKILKYFIISFVLISIGLLILNQHKDKLFFHNETVGVRVVFSMQNPESGEYENSVQEEFLVDKGTPYEYQPKEYEGYDVNFEKSYLKSESVLEPTEFVVYYDCELCTVTFSGGEGELASGQETLTLRKGQTLTEFPKYEKIGYDHVGFTPEIGKITQDTNFEAVFELTQYKVYLYLIEGGKITAESYENSELARNSYVKTFDFTMDFALPTPTHESSEYLFEGWNTSADGSGENYSDVARGTLQDVHLYAIYNVKTYRMVFMLDGEEYTSQIAPYGTSVYAPSIPAEKQIAGYGLNWYSDQNFESLYEFKTMPQEGATVYGKWELDTGTGFLGWSPENEKIDDYKELKMFVDYVRFYNVTTKNYKLEVTYTDSKTTIENDLKTANATSDFRCGYPVSYGAGTEGANSPLYAICFCAEENTYEHSLLSTNKNDYEVYGYWGYEEKGRGNDYNDFYIEKLLNSQTVEYTNQLLYVVEHGYKPICKPNSPAEKVYNEAKKILNQIIGVNYNDYQKVEAIYDWLVLNVQYDHNALSREVSYYWYKYDAFYMEGVFNNRKAVCDGIAKSFTLLCNIEGIPCVEVSGNSHAWCKVKVNNAWYVADATQGNVQITEINKSVMSHSEFLISDAQKQSRGYTTASYPNIKANSTYNYFANKTYVKDENVYDFIVNDVDEMVALLKHAVKVQPNLSYLSIDLVNNTGKQLSTVLDLAKTKLAFSGIFLNYVVQIVGEASDPCQQIIFE